MIRNDIKNLWFKISDKIRFLLVGGMNFLISYVIYLFWIFILGRLYYQAALALAWLISSVISFTTQRLLVFQVKRNLFKRYLKCCITWFFSYLINAFFLEVLVQKFQINVYIGQIIANISAAIFTYIMFKIFAFKPEN